jgi:tetratricopeptide (TPR) repeat protein
MEDCSRSDFLERLAFWTVFVAAGWKPRFRTDIRRFCSADRGIMAWVDMMQEPTRSRFLTALRLAFYPAFEPVETKHFQALTMEAENARGSGDLPKAEKLYSTAMAEARSSSDSSHLSHARHGLGRVYQEQRKYREAEHIFRDLLQEAVNSPQPNTQVHAGHMSLAQMYQDEGKFAEAEEHYKAAVAETEKTELWPGSGFFCSTSMWLANFYVAQHRYSEAEPLFQRALEIYEEDRGPNSYLPHHLQEFAKLYEAQEKYVAAEQMYRRVLEICEQSRGANSPFTGRALDNLARFCRERGRYVEAERLCRRTLATVEENVRSQTAPWSKGWRRWRNRKELEAKISRNQIPVSSALDRLSEICEYQQKYAEAEPLRRRSLEIKERAWGERRSWYLVDSLAALANVLHKTDREQEAAEFDKRVEAILAKYPQGSVRGTLRAMSRPLKRNLRWRFFTFVNAILHPSRFPSNSH